jgi:hypothetical protein
MTVPAVFPQPVKSSSDLNMLPGRFMAGFQCGLLRNVSAQPFTQFLRVVCVDQRIVAPA